MPHGSQTVCFWRLFFFSCVILASCKVQLKLAFEEPPLFPRIQARVGMSFPGPVQSYSYADPLTKVDFGQTSRSRFEQVFRSMFSETVLLPDWPPWRESKVNLDGVIELSKAQINVEVGNDWEDRPDSVFVAYQVCLYHPDGSTVNCWDTKASQVHQREILECLNLSHCLKIQIEAATREAIASFMLEFEGDPFVEEWTQSLTEASTAP